MRQAGSVPDVDLGEARRNAFVERLRMTLAETAPSAEVAVAGSLATRSHDRYSDIDLLLSVAAEEFSGCLLAVPAALNRAQPVRLLRLDPDTVALPDHRLVFALFRDLPLFWRLDLHVRATSVASGTTALSDLPWSLPASALMNGVAAVKAMARGDQALATALLVRGFDRIGVASPDSSSVRERIAALAGACAAHEPAVNDIAQEVTALAQSYWSREG
jgi:predicted nucleotidyltransferase